MVDKDFYLRSKFVNITDDSHDFHEKLFVFWFINWVFLDTFNGVFVEVLKVGKDSFYLIQKEVGVNVDPFVNLNFEGISETRDLDF